MPKPWENAEGYHDPTAYHGTKNIIRDEDEQPKRLTSISSVRVGTGMEQIFFLYLFRTKTLDFQGFFSCFQGTEQMEQM